MPATSLYTGSNGHSPIVDMMKKGSTVNESWESATDIFEYTSSANPDMLPIPNLGLEAKEHTTGPTRVTSLDASNFIGIDDYPASSPNLLASFLRVCIGESLTTSACATSQVTTLPRCGEWPRKNLDIILICYSQNWMKCWSKLGFCSISLITWCLTGYNSTTSS